MQNANATLVRWRAWTVRMSPASRQICPLARQRLARGAATQSQRDPTARRYALVAGWRDRFAAHGGDCGRRRHLSHCLYRIGRGLRAVKIAAINERSARVRHGEKNQEQKQRQPFHSVDANRSFVACQIRQILFRKTRLHDVDLAGKFGLRQGLWIEDLRTPPGQECSNGSLILLAVVLWRTFLVGYGHLAHRRRPGEPCVPLGYEAPQS